MGSREKQDLRLPGVSISGVRFTASGVVNGGSYGFRRHFRRSHPTASPASQQARHIVAKKALLIGDKCKRGDSHLTYRDVSVPTKCLEKAPSGACLREEEVPCAENPAATICSIDTRKPPPKRRRRPWVSVIIDDMGVDYRSSMRAVHLKEKVTLSYLPYADYLKPQVAAATSAGHELMLHMPMQPFNQKADPGEQALMSQMTTEELLDKLQWSMGQFDGYVGVNNHMGSHFTSQAREGMALLLNELDRRGLFFLDSLTSSESHGPDLASEIGMRYATRDIFLDPIRDNPALVAAQLGALERLARRNNHAIAIGHPYGTTLEELEKWLPTLKKKGLKLMPLGKALKQVQRNREHEACSAVLSATSTAQRAAAESARAKAQAELSAKQAAAKAEKMMGSGWVLAWEEFLDGGHQLLHAARSRKRARRSKVHGELIGSRWQAVRHTSPPKPLIVPSTGFSMPNWFMKKPKQTEKPSHSSKISGLVRATRFTTAAGCYQATRPKSLEFRQVKRLRGRAPSNPSSLFPSTSLALSLPTFTSKELTIPLQSQKPGRSKSVPSPRLRVPSDPRGGSAGRAQKEELSQPESRQIAARRKAAKQSLRASVEEKGKWIVSEGSSESSGIHTASSRVVSLSNASMGTDYQSARESELTVSQSASCSADDERTGTSRGTGSGSSRSTGSSFSVNQPPVRRVAESSEGPLAAVSVLSEESGLAEPVEDSLQTPVLSVTPVQQSPVKSPPRKVQVTSPPKMTPVVSMTPVTSPPKTTPVTSLKAPVKSPPKRKAPILSTPQRAPVTSPSRVKAPVTSPSKAQAPVASDPPKAPPLSPPRKAPAKSAPKQTPVLSPLREAAGLSPPQFRPPLLRPPSGYEGLKALVHMPSPQAPRLRPATPPLAPSWQDSQGGVPTEGPHSWPGKAGINLLRSLSDGSASLTEINCNQPQTGESSESNSGGVSGAVSDEVVKGGSSSSLARTGSTAGSVSSLGSELLSERVVPVVEEAQVSSSKEKKTGEGFARRQSEGRARVAQVGNQSVEIRRQSSISSSGSQEPEDSMPEVAAFLFSPAKDTLARLLKSGTDLLEKSKAENEQAQALKAKIEGQSSVSETATSLATGKEHAELHEETRGAQGGAYGGTGLEAEVVEKDTRVQRSAELARPQTRETKIPAPADLPKGQESKTKADEQEVQAEKAPSRFFDADGETAAKMRFGWFRKQAKLSSGSKPGLASVGSVNESKSHEATESKATLEVDAGKPVEKVPPKKKGFGFKKSSKQIHPM